MLSYVLLNNWPILPDYLYIYLSLPPVTSSRLHVGAFKFSNQPVVESTIAMKVRLTLFIMIGPTGCCCLIDLIYSPIKSICKKSHSFSSAMFLGCSCPWRVFLYLNRWHILHCLAYSYTCVTRPFQKYTYQKNSQVYYHQGGSDRNGTNLAHICIASATLIFFYHIRLSQHHQ